MEVPSTSGNKKESYVCSVCKRIYTTARLFYKDTMKKTLTLARNVVNAIKLKTTFLTAHHQKKSLLKAKWVIYRQPENAPENPPENPPEKPPQKPHTFA